jgi:hypothetical protein
MSYQIVLYKPVPVDQYRVLNGHLRYEMEKYEELTRRNCGIKNGGLRLINHSTDQFIEYVLELAWTFLDELKKSNPARYQRILSGEEGDAIPVGICLSYFVKTRMFSEPKRLQFDIGKDIPRRANGMPVELDNAFRTIRDIRYKITANKTTRHANGVLSKGFDFFTDWTGINAQGQPDRKGRRGHIGFVNLKYVLGPDWKMECAGCGCAAFCGERAGLFRLYCGSFGGCFFDWVWMLTHLRSRSVKTEIQKKCHPANGKQWYYLLTTSKKTASKTCFDIAFNKKSLCLC